MLRHRRRSVAPEAPAGPARRPKFASDSSTWRPQPDAVGDAAYNLVFHTAPHHHDGPFHWHVHIVPRLTSLAGFEQGTGVMINIVAPELAARHLTG